LTLYCDEGFAIFTFFSEKRRLHILLISLEPVIVVLTQLTIAARSYWRMFELHERSSFNQFFVFFYNKGSALLDEG
jgi:hypothetical protein